ncbi:aldose epimerase family protein [Streptodolium elevatio]|uniref:Aldose 1-epimerase n=1 Tax=Streptodolium elevatio TaxID=3157996 RepID=A0ABV3DT22_9ACTN
MSRPEQGGSPAQPAGTAGSNARTYETFPATAPTVRQKSFGTTPDGTPVHRWSISSPSSGVEAAVLSYGAILQSCQVPDLAGRYEDVVLGLPGVPDYAADDAYLGAVVGRYANRIAHGRFVLDGVTYELPTNDRGHTLHGGMDGFHRRVWAGVGFADGERAGVRLRLRSPHMDMGFPGALDVEVTYSLDTDGTLAVDYRATTDRPTVVNLTQHAYWNLEGQSSAGDVLGHRLGVDADAFLPIDPGGIPYGDAASVRGTPFDFTPPAATEGPAAAVSLGDRVRSDHPQVAAVNGLDHCLVLRGGVGLRRAALLHAPESGRVLETWTTEPGLQIYTANALGAPFGRHAAVCLETQRFPDSPNRPAYPSTVLRPGQAHCSSTQYRFTHLPTR